MHNFSSRAGESLAALELIWTCYNKKWQVLNTLKNFLIVQIFVKSKITDWLRDVSSIVFE